MSYELAEKLKAVDAYLFREHSSTAKYNAQRNLSGLTHYVDDDSLRYHHSRINSCRILEGGAFLYVRESLSLDMRNTERGHRVVLFNIFGRVVNSAPLEACASNGDKAEQIFWAWFDNFDGFAYYRDLFQIRAEHSEKEAARYAQSAQLLVSSEVAQ